MNESLELAATSSPEDRARTSGRWLLKSFSVVDWNGETAANALLAYRDHTAFTVRAMAGKPNVSSTKVVTSTADQLPGTPGRGRAGVVR